LALEQQKGFAVDKDEAQKRIRKLARAGKIEAASQDGINQFGWLSQEFLSRCLDHPEAWISDESCLSDFGKKNEETYARIEKLYGVDVRGKNNLLEIFRAIEAVNRTRQ
jgi:hypothetical protein